MTGTITVLPRAQLETTSEILLATPQHSPALRSYPQPPPVALATIAVAARRWYGGGTWPLSSGFCAAGPAPGCRSKCGKTPTARLPQATG